MSIKYNSIKSKSAIHKLNDDFVDYDYSLNIYRGCVHNCIYCYAIYSHFYIEKDTDNFFNEITVKENIVEVLERELKNKNYKKGIIYINTVTDCYQACEAKYKIMPEVLKLMIKYKNPISISTKSDLILRDYNLFDELSRLTYVNIKASIITLDGIKHRFLEPYTVSPERRFNMLESFNKTNVETNVNFIPLIPYINNSEKDIESIISMAKEKGVDYLVAGFLNLIGDTRKMFYQYLDDKADLRTEIYNLIKDEEQYKEYRKKIYSVVQKYLLKYKIESNSKYDLSIFRASPQKELLLDII